jgi:hypothetical protein
LLAAMKAQGFLASYQIAPHSTGPEAEDYSEQSTVASLI